MMSDTDTWLYFIRNEPSVLLCASRAFLSRELTGALLEPNIHVSHRSVSFPYETLNPENQLKHTGDIYFENPRSKKLKGSWLGQKYESRSFGCV